MIPVIDKSQIVSIICSDGDSSESTEFIDGVEYCNERRYCGRYRIEVAQTKPYLISD